MKIMNNVVVNVDINVNIFEESNNINNILYYKHRCAVKVNVKLGC